MKVKKVSEKGEERVIQTFTVKPGDSENAKRRQTRSDKGVTRGKNAGSDQHVISSEYVNLQDIKIAGRHGA